MIIAIDKDGKLVHAEEAIVGEQYFCPTCKSELILKAGTEKQKHFAHKSVCPDNWHYDMSEWHLHMQSYFPKEMREKVITLNGVSHRADVIIPSINNFAEIVFEFQHSPISYKEFEERNKFYTDAGYVVLWIFDTNNRPCVLDDDKNICFCKKRRHTVLNKYAKAKKYANVYIGLSYNTLPDDMNGDDKILWADMLLDGFKEFFIDALGGLGSMSAYKYDAEGYNNVPGHGWDSLYFDDLFERLHPLWEHNN